VRASFSRNGLRKGFANDAAGIELLHGERPRFDVADRKTDRNSVNETKSALFSWPCNDRFVGNARTEKFATIVVQSLIIHARQQENWIDQCA
jgi:hypothetical protein